MEPSSIASPRVGARSTLFALLATAVDKGGGMLVLLLVARLLGTEDFGRYAALMSLLAFFQIASELGQEPVLVRMLAQTRPREAGDLVAGALAMRLVLALVGGAALVVVGRLLLPTAGVIALALTAAGLVTSFGVALRAVFRATQRLEWLCVTATVRVTTFVLALLAGHALGLGLQAAVAGWAVGQLATTVTAMILVRPYVTPRPRWRSAVAARLARSGSALALNTFLLTVTLRIGHLIVLHLDGPSAVGYLAAGSQLAEAFAVIPEAVMLAVLPVLSAYDRESRTAQRALSVRVVRILTLLSLPVVITVCLTAPTLLAWLYGTAFLAGAPALRILAWLALLAATGTVLTNLLIARGLERVLLAVNLVTSLLTLGSSLLAVPRFGFVGAAFATLLSSVAGQLLLLALPETRADVAACLRPLAGPVLTAAVLVVAGIGVVDSGVVAAPVAVAAFVLTMAATGTVGWEDWALVRRLARGGRG